MLEIEILSFNEIRTTKKIRNLFDQINGAEFSGREFFRLGKNNNPE